MGKSDTESSSERCRDPGPLKVLSASLQWSTVRVRGIYGLTAEAGPGPVPEPEPPCPSDNFYVDGRPLCGRDSLSEEEVPPPDDLVTYSKSGNGWFFSTKSGIIVTAASNVLIDPRELANNNRWPFVRPDQPAPNGTIPTSLTKVSRIVVSFLKRSKCGTRVSVNNCDANLFAVDGTGNIALLKLCSDTVCNDPLELGEGCTTPKGSLAYTVMGAQDFFTGTVVNQYYTAPNGEFQAEHIKTDFSYDVIYPGAPVVNENNKVIGMLTSDNSGPSADFLAYVLGKMSKLYNIIIDNCKNKGKSTQQRFTPIHDSLGTFYAFRKVYLGVLWDNVNALSFTTNYDLTTGDYNMITNNKGKFDDLKGCDINRGIVVTNYAGNTQPAENRLPGATDTPVAPMPSLVNTPLSIVLPGKTVLFNFSGLNKAPFFGDSPSNCRAPGLFTWKLDPCKNTTIYFNTIPFGETASKTDLSDKLVYMPLAIDYPFFEEEYVPLSPTPPGPVVTLPFSTSAL